MEFVIERTIAPAAPAVVPAPDQPTAYTWRLVAAAGTLCQSPEPYQSVALARGSIAQFKRSASGVRFAKVREAQDA